MAKSTSRTSVADRERTLLEGILYYSSFLLRYKYLIISITLASAIGVVMFSLISLRLPPEQSPLPNYYRAYSVLIVGQEGGSSMTTMLSALGIEAPGDDEMNYGELGIRVLRSRPFVDEIVKKHNIIQEYEIEDNVRTSSREIILNNSIFNYDSRTGTLTISYESIDPVFARDIVQSMVDGLQEWFRKWEGTSSQQQLRAMEQKIEEVSQEISRLEQEIQSFQTKYGVFSVDQLAEAQSAMITDLQSQLLQTEMAIKNYSGFATIEDQELIQLKAQRESLQELIQQIESGQGSSGVRDMPAKDEIPRLAIDYSHLTMSHEIQMRIFQNLKEQYEVQKLTSSSGSVFSVLDPVEVPEEKSRPKRSELCMIVTVIGFFGSIGLAIILHVIKKVKNDPEKRRILRGTAV